MKGMLRRKSFMRESNFGCRLLECPSIKMGFMRRQSEDDKALSVTSARSAVAVLFFQPGQCRPTNRQSRPKVRCLTSFGAEKEYCS